MIKRSAKNMDAILFSANPSMVQVDDAVRHLADHEELYWEVGFQIIPDKFSFPILGFIHIKGGQVEYKVTIKDIVPFSREHYEGQNAKLIKPDIWLTEWKNNLDNCRNYPWKNALVMTSIEPFSYDTYQFLRYNGEPIKKPTQSYIRVLPPEKLRLQSTHTLPDIRYNEQKPITVSKTRQVQLAEINLEEFVINQLDEIESGLRLEKRQLHTDAGRLDLLCKDRDGQYVVVELKRSQGNDQVVGQILRYMGWALENYRTDKVRGIIIVGKKDQALSYAIKAVPNIQVKEFKILIE